MSVTFAATIVFRSGNALTAPKKIIRSGSIIHFGRKFFCPINAMKKLPREAYSLVSAVDAYKKPAQCAGENARRRSSLSRCSLLHWMTTVALTGAAHAVHIFRGTTCGMRFFARAADIARS